MRSGCFFSRFSILGNNLQRRASLQALRFFSVARASCRLALLLSWPSRWIGRRRKGFHRRATSRVGGNSCRCGLCNANSVVPAQVIFGARGAISLPGVFIALACQFITAAYAIAVSGLGSGFYRYKGHRSFSSKDSMNERRQEVKEVNEVQEVKENNAPRRDRCSVRVSLLPLPPISLLLRCHAFRFFRCAKRNGDPKFSRNSTQCDSGIDRNTSTIFGSNCVPAQRRISSRA
jgi:hypothetical protein